MAALKMLESQLRLMTECKICFEDKEQQKQLPCQHTICLDCLEKLSITDSQYKCPLCMKKHPIPNGGFTALPESLVTKQLANLIHSQQWAAAIRDQQPSNEANYGGDNSMKELSATAKRLKNAKEAGNEVLQLAEKKIQVFAEECERLTANEEEMTGKLNKMADEIITKLNVNLKRKVEGVKQATQSKLDVVSAKKAALEDVYSKAKSSVQVVTAKADQAEPNSQDIEREIKNAQEVCEELKSEMQKITNRQKLREGESVRLKMDAEQLNPEFFDDELTHSSTGYIQDWDQDDDDDDCAVIFPDNTRWVGKVSRLEKSPVNHNLPVLGDRVKVKASVDKPFFEWQDASSDSVGYLTEVKNCGPPGGREVRVDFPDDHDWHGLFKEIEKLPPDALKVGDLVWFGRKVSEPARGWAGVTPNSVGTLLSVCGQDVVVKFPECEKWQGLLSELEKTRPIIVGDKVKVMKSVDPPTTGWDGVTHEHEGVVKKFGSHKDKGSVAVIDFPHLPKLWVCLVSELEISERLCPGRSKSGSLEGLLGALHASRMARELADDTCDTQ